MEDIKVMGVRGLPIIHAGDDIAALICKKVTKRKLNYTIKFITTVETA